MDKLTYNLFKTQANIRHQNIFLDSYPSQIHFLMVDKCNVKCIMCGGDYFKSKSGRAITLDKFKKMAANLRFELIGAIVLAGAGDPLLNRDLLPIVQFVRSTYPHITISVTTNGLALTQDISARLIDSGVALVNISINAATLDTYKRIMQIDGFEAVCKNARNFVELRGKAGKPVALQFSAALNRLNIEELPRLVELGRELGVNSINVFYTRFYPERIRHANVDDPADRLEDSASLFFHQELSDRMVSEAKDLARKAGIGFSHEPLFREHAAAAPCTWATTQLMVGFDGEVYPCGGSEVHFREKVEGGVYDFGNALHEPIDAFWNKELYRALRQSARQTGECLVPECRCCANVVSPNDIRSHIMQWDGDEARQVEPRPAEPAGVVKEALVPAPLVSVIIPTCNRPDQLAGALRSVLEQLYGNIEIIVVNDCGVDVENIVSFLNKENRITYVRHGKNMGLAAARNTGIKLARGKYLAYLDDDDLFYPDHIETLVRFLESSDYKIAYTDAHRAHQAKQNGVYVVTGRDVPYSFDFDYDRILQTNFVPVLCFMHERACLAAAGLFDEDLKRLEDWDLWIRLSRSFKIAHIKKVTCEFSWRTDGTTMTSGQEQEFVRAREQISRKYRGSQPDGVSPSRFPKPATRNLVSIVILTINQLPYTQECVASIRKHTPEPHEIVFVDNASTDGTVAWLQELVARDSRYVLIKNDENRGFAKGCNQGMAVASGEYVLLLNNDVVVTPGWLSGLLECLNFSPDTGIVGPMTNCALGRQQVPMVDYTALTELDEYAVAYREKHRYRRIPSWRIIGYCMLFRRELVERIGGFDERYGIGTSEDDDFCLRAVLAGFDNYIAADLFIHHYGHKSFSGNKIDADELFEKNRRLFLEKWKVDPYTPQGKKLAAFIAVSDGTEACEGGDLEKAFKDFLDGVKLAPAEARLYWDFAEMLLDARLYQQAMNLLDITPKEIKQELRTIEQLGYVREGIGQLAEAEACAKQVLALSPRSAPALNLLGAIACKKGDHSGAESFLKQAISADKSSGRAFTNLGLLKWEAGDHEGGFSSLERGFMLSPALADSASHYQAAAIGLERFEQAEALFREAKGFYPNHRQLAFLLIDLLLKQQHFKEAMAEVEAALLTFGVDDGLVGAAKAVRSKIGPLTVVDRREGSPATSLCMVVYNQETLLAESLAAAKPLIQEIVVVDLGSNDRTKEIAEIFGARVFDLAWRGDGAAARNFALEQALGDWIFVLDADEQLLPADHALFSSLTSRRRSKPKAYRFVIRKKSRQREQGFVEDGVGEAAKPKRVAACSAVRLFTRRPGIRFANGDEPSVEGALKKLHVRVEDAALVICDCKPSGRGGWVEKKSPSRADETGCCRPARDGAGQAADEVGSDAASVKGGSPIPGLTSIVILTFNQLRYTQECVDSIRKHTAEPYEFIFVDNGSTDGTVAWLRRFAEENPHCRVIENKNNFGFAKGCNQGIDAAAGQYVLLLNNDTVVTPGWLAGMLNCLNNSEDIGVVGPMTNNISGPQKLAAVDYADLEGLDAFARDFQKRFLHRRIEQNRIVGFCLLFRKELADKIGGLDESFGTGNFEDDDFCLRANLHGYRNFIAGDVFIHHYGSVSFAGSGLDYGALIGQNRRIFSEKWGGLQTEEGVRTKLVVLQGLQSGEVLRQKGQVREAVDLLVKLIGHHQDNPRIYYALAEILLEEAEYQAASEVIQEAPNKDQDALLLMFMAACKEGQGKHEEADALIDRALAAAPTSARILNQKGVIALHRGEQRAAEEFFNRSAAADPGLGAPYANLGIMRWEEGVHAAALDLLEKGFVLLPTAKSEAANYHTAAIGLGEFERAERYFRDALSIYPSCRRLSDLLVNLLLLQNKLAEAMRELEKAAVVFGVDEELLGTALQVRGLLGPMAIDAKQQASLSVCMIVKDEEKNIARCLHSIQPVADEIIVVDTGSGDRTKEIAALFGAKVHDFPWDGDFSAARNYSISHAQGDWIFVMDADEVIAERDYNKMKQLITDPKQGACAYSFVSRNYVDRFNYVELTPNDGRYPELEAGEGWIPSAKVRLFPNEKRLRFAYSVHEMVEPSLLEAGIVIKKSDVPIHHYGNMADAHKREKGEAYYRLGMKKLVAEGDNKDALREMAVQAAHLDKFDESAELWERYLKLEPNSAKGYANLCSAYARLGRYQEALAAAERSVNLDPELPAGLSNYAFVLMHVGRAEQAITVYRQFMDRHPEHAFAAQFNLAACYSMAGRKAEAGLIYEKLQRSRVAPALGNSCKELTEGLLAAGQRDYALALLEAVIENHFANDEVIRLWQGIRLA